MIDDDNYIIEDKPYNGNPLLKKEGVQINFTPEMIQERIKCKNDPIYFIEKYVKIITEDGLSSFKLRDYQVDLVESMIDNRYTIAKMARQSGKTEAVRGFLLHYIIFNDQKTVGLLANKGDTAKEILGKLQTSYQHLPKWLQQGVKEFNKNSFVLENGCRVIAAATSSDAVRGYTFQCLVLDETAFIENFDEFFASVYPTVSEGKRTKVIMISTPCGLNHFYKIWKDAEEGRNPYNRIEAIWSDVPGRDEAWRAMTLQSMNNDIEKFDQEFNCEFMGSSGTLIAGWKLKELVQGRVLEEKLGIKQYVIPQEDHSYVLVADVSRGKGLDYSAFSIIDVTDMPYQQVCVYRSNLTTPLDYAQIIYNMAKIYHNAYVLVEINDIGEQVSSSVLFDFEYENIIYTINNGRGGKTVSSGFGQQSSQDRGIRTTRQVKNIGCSLLKLLVEQNQFIVNDFDTIHELSTFSRKNNSYEAETGSTDDLVMGLVLFAWLSDQGYFKEFSDNYTLQNLRDRTEEEIMADLVPFGFTSEYESLGMYEKASRQPVEGEWATYEGLRDLYDF